MSSPHDHPSTSFFVRAAFHYRATDASSIDLAEGDLIEVFSQLDNGWWDGRLVTKFDCPRGWFPGTFVVPVSDEEAQQEIISAIYRPIDGWFGLGSSDHLKSTNREDTTYMTSVVDDFWLPDVMTDGRVIYRNSWTGEETSSVPSPPVQISGLWDRPSRPVSFLSSSDSSKSDDAATLLKPKGDRVNPKFGSRAFRETGTLLVAALNQRSTSHPRDFFDVPLTIEEVNHHANSIRQALQELSRITRKAMGDAGRRMLYPRDSANKLVEKVLRLLYIAGGLARPCLSQPDEVPRVGLPSPAFCRRHRNVIVAISHLILSLREARHSSISITTGNQVIHDVTEVARTVFTLVRELACSSSPRQKVLEVMAPSSISAIKPKSSNIPLGAVTLGIFKSLRSNVDETFAVLRGISAQGPAACRKNTELISIAVSQLSTLLACAEALDIPRLSEVELTSRRTLRMDTVSHDMDATKTSLFNEGMLLLSAIRPPKVPPPVERTTPCVHDLTSSILRRVQQLEACIIELVFLNYWGMTHSSVLQPRPIPPPRLSVNHSESFRVPEPVDLEHSSSSSSSSDLSTVDGAPISLSSASTPEIWEEEETASGPVSCGPGIFTNSDGSVRGGTLEALVEHLTPHDQQDFAFHHIFFLTLRSFTTVSEVFPLLVARFNVAPPDDLDPILQEDWAHKIRHLIRIRVIKAVISLLQADGVVRREDSSTLNDIKAFANEISALYPSAKRLVTLADIAKHRDPSFIRTPGYEPVSPPPPRAPKMGSDRRLSLLDLDPLEVARQLTLKESALFKKIAPGECFARARECPKPHDNFSTCIALANQTAYWVCDEILHRQEPKGRAAVIGHLINIAHHCRGLNNFSSMTAIVAGLNSTPIHRLKRSWSEVKPKAMALFQEVEAMVRSWKNLTEFRKAMTDVTGPCVPFLGVYLTALLFIQNGVKDTLDTEGKIINFAKHAKAAETVIEIQAYQAIHYNLSVVPSIRLFIDKSLLVTATPDEFWERSLEREPRDSVPDVPSERRWLLMSSFVVF